MSFRLILSLTGAISRASMIACAAALVFTSCQSAAAQTTAAKKQTKSAAGSKAASAAPAKSTKAPVKAAPTKAAPKEEGPESYGRQEVLKGKEWQETMKNLDDWLGKQTIYDADQVKQIRARMNNGLGKMSGSELRRFMIDMQAKLKGALQRASPRGRGILKRNVRGRLARVCSPDPSAIA